MANLVNSIEKRVKKIFRIEDKVKNDIPLGSILCKIHDARYGDPFSVIAHAGGGRRVMARVQNYIPTLWNLF
ncbi:hypothetical protein [Vibrio vulnificus]|uniref:hypothetical protein n=1 Tax=Vibrio vulnificus TaxID=672 RepID=UPI0015599DD7|nr:hypothetical protein [Vibrio vulnificus]